MAIATRIGALLVVVGLATACGGGGAGGAKVVAGVDDASRWSDDLLRDLRAGQPDDLRSIVRRTPPPTLQDEVARLADETQNVAVSAFCEAVTSVVTTGELPSYEAWFDWARGEFEAGLVGYPFDLDAYIDGKADELATTLELVQINPQLARLYVERCRVLGL